MKAVSTNLSYVNQATRAEDLERKCAFLTRRLEDFILQAADASRVKSVGQTPAHPQPLARDPDESVVWASFETLLGRSPSPEDISFYRHVGKTYGSRRIFRDILLSSESVNRNAIPPIAALALRIFWHP